MWNIERGTGENSGVGWDESLGEGRGGARAQAERVLALVRVWG